MGAARLLLPALTLVAVLVLAADGAATLSTATLRARVRQPAANATAATPATKVDNVAQAKIDLTAAMARKAQVKTQIQAKKKDVAAAMTGFSDYITHGIWEDTGDGTDINAVDCSHDRSVLATGDDFGRVRIYKFPVMVKDAPSKTFNGHSSHVTSVRFSPDDKILFSTGGADTGVFQWRHGAQ